MKENKNVPKLRFNEFTEEWKKTKLNLISDITSSKRIYAKDYVEEGIPFYRGKEISCLKNKQNIEDLLYISEEKYNEIKQNFSVPVKNDILITSVGTLGNIYIVPDNKPFYFKDGNLIWLKNIQVNSIFLSYILIKNKHEILTHSIGSTQKALTIIEIEKLEILLPSTGEQTKIADFLSLIDKKIELLEKKLSLYQSLLKFYIENLFNQKIKIKKFNDKWEEKEIKDIFVERNERNYNELDLLSVTINEGVKKRIEINSIDNSSDDKSKYKHVCTGDIPYNSMRMWQGASGVSPYEGIISPAYTVLKPKKDVYSNFFGYYFKTNKMLYEFRKYSQGLTSDTWNLKYPLISEIKIKIPSFSDQIKIFNFLNIFERKINIIKNFIEAMTKFKIGLIQQMFI